MKAANLFFGLLFLALAYGVTIPSFSFPLIPGWIDLPIPNPLYRFASFAICIVLLGLIWIISAFDTTEPTESAEIS